MRQPVRRIPAFALLAAAAFAGDGAAKDLLVRVEAGGQTVEGLVLAHDEHRVYIADDHGVVRQLVIDSVRSYRATGGRFRPVSAVRLRGELRDEFGRGYEVAASGRTVVVAPPGRARTYLAVVDEVQDAFKSHFSRRRIPLPDPATPLVTVVFETRAEFDAYSRADGVPASANVRGYYLRTSNRIALYEPASGGGPSLAGLGDLRGTPRGRRASDRAMGTDAATVASVRGTLVHEATHQMAYNTGLHHRVGSNPKWVVEGLATMFEPAGMRSRVQKRDPATRTNTERLLDFQRTVRPKWSTGRLTTLVSSDSPFTQSPAEAYATAWALSFYLSETRPTDYARFLSRLKERSPTGDYSAGERLTDFRSAFGRDLARFDAGFLRFIDGLPDVDPRDLSIGR